MEGVMSISILFLLLLLHTLFGEVVPFHVVPSTVVTSKCASTRTTARGSGALQQHEQHRQSCLFAESTLDRRTTLRYVASVAAVTAVTVCSIFNLPWVDSEAAAMDMNNDEMKYNNRDSTSLEMKQFVDPLGLFVISTPSYFFRLRRSSKGDLPDSETGTGRRGSSIFTAGDMNKAEIVAIERYPIRILLEENGVEAVGDLSTFPSIGQPSAVANLINLRREKDKSGGGGRGGFPNTQIFNVSLDPINDKILHFMIKSEIEVQKPELLMEQYGVDRLYRITTAKASLESNDGNIMVVFASALESDFQGPDGMVLEQIVDSFVATDQPASTTKRS